MSVANSKKAAPSNSNLAVAGALARMRRRGVSSRVGRRSALLGVLSSMYTSSSRANGTNRSAAETGASGERA